MSKLAAIYGLYCYCDYEPSPQDIEAQQRYLEEQKEREKVAILSSAQFKSLARAEPESGGTDLNRHANNLNFHNN